MACPRKKVTVSYIKEILSLTPSCVRSFTRIFISRRVNSSLPPWNHIQWGDEYSTNAITLFLADLPHGIPACRPFLSSRCIPEYEEYQPIKRTIEPANTIVVRGLPILRIHKTNFFVCISIFFFFLQAIIVLEQASLISHDDAFWSAIINIILLIEIIKETKQSSLCSLFLSQ